MIYHIDFGSDCKRIAKYIMKQGSNPSSEQFCDMVDLGVITVSVSGALLSDFAKDVKTYTREINKNLKGCSVTYKTHGIGGDWFIKFGIEFDEK